MVDLDGCELSNFAAGEPSVSAVVLICSWLAYGHPDALILGPSMLITGGSEGRDLGR